MSTREDARKPQYRAPALEKGLEVLELMANQPEGLSQAQIAQQLNRSPDSLFRIFVCLEENGYLYRERPGDAYQLTSRLFTLAHQHPPTRRLSDVAIPLMRTLSEKAVQSCHLSIPMPEGMLIIAQVEAPTTIGFSVRKGRTLDLTTSSSGMVYRAFAAQKTTQPLSERNNTLREQGYILHKSVTVESITDLAVPILDANGHAAAVLCIPHLRFLQNTEAPEDCLPALLKAGQQISKAFNPTLRLS